MDELARKRAEKRQDSRLWTAEDALEDLLARIRAGEIKPTWLAIHYMEGSPETGQEHHYQVAGLTYPQHIALLNVALDRVLREWRVP